MKKLVLLIVAFIVLVVGIVYITTSLTSGLLDAHKTAAAICNTYPVTHTVVIQNDTVSPEHVQASRCDKLTIINRDNKQREIAFGQHDNHVAYGGVLERTLKQNQEFTVTLDKTGDYHFHDHHQDEVGGTFSVQ